MDSTVVSHLSEQRGSSQAWFSVCWLLSGDDTLASAHMCKLGRHPAYGRLCVHAAVRMIVARVAQPGL